MTFPFRLVVWEFPFAAPPRHRRPEQPFPRGLSRILARRNKDKNHGDNNNTTTTTTTTTLLSFLVAEHVERYLLVLILLY